MQGLTNLENAEIKKRKDQKWTLATWHEEHVYYRMVMKYLPS